MIRAARPRDIDAIVGLWEREGGPTRLAGGHDEAVRLIDRDPEALLVAERNGTVVGTLIVGWDGWRCHLYRLVVDPAHRRDGVARELVLAAQRRADGLGARRLDAMVHRGNEKATSFWKAVGFEEDEDDGRWSLLL